MAPSSLSSARQEQLLGLAWDSIRHGLKTGHILKINLDDYPIELQEPRATFVTLERRRQLRGCIGILQAIRPLVEDVAEHAFAAAFRDPRFPALTEMELPELELHISILSPAAELHFTSEPELISLLQAGKDGLILEYAGRKATFLPSVWESLPDPANFVQHLKQKAGLSAVFWSDKIRAFRYTVEYFGETYRA